MILVSSPDGVVTCACGLSQKDDVEKVRAMICTMIRVVRNFSFISAARARPLALVMLFSFFFFISGWVGVGIIYLVYLFHDTTIQQAHDVGTSRYCSLFRVCLWILYEDQHTAARTGRRLYECIHISLTTECVSVCVLSPPPPPPMECSNLPHGMYWDVLECVRSQHHSSGWLGVKKNRSKKKSDMQAEESV